jgi:hypothetical protein
LRWILSALAGTATGSGGTVTTFVPTFGHIDGGESITGLVDALLASAGGVDSRSVLSGVDAGSQSTVVESASRLVGVID